MHTVGILFVPPFLIGLIGWTIGELRRRPADLAHDLPHLRAVHKGAREEGAPLLCPRIIRVHKPCPSWGSPADASDAGAPVIIILGSRHMWKLLLASTTIALAASIGVAKAQNAPGTSPQTAQPSEQTTQPSERGVMMPGMMGGRMMGREMGEHSRERHMMMAQTPAAIFHIRRGDTSIFIKCAENESTQACITAAGTLLDKFNSPTPPRP